MEYDIVKIPKVKTRNMYDPNVGIVHTSRIADLVTFPFTYSTGVKGHINFITERIWVWDGDGKRHEFHLNAYMVFEGNLTDFLKCKGFCV